VGDGQDDGQQGGNVGRTQSHGGRGSRKLLVSRGREIDERVGIVVKLAKFVLALVKALPKLIARGSAAVAFG
jgi:hypothetical protein